MDNHAITDTDLILRHIDGQLSDAEFAALNARLGQDAAFRGRFIALLLQANYVAASMGQDQPVTAKPDLSTPKVRMESTIKFQNPKALLALAAALLLTAAAVAIYSFAINPKSEIRNPKSTTPIATLIDSTGDVFVNDDIANPGSDYAAGDYAIESGSAGFLLRSGATVRLTGSARLIVHDKMNATLTRGTAEFNCPASAQGYTVMLPGGGRVVDLGTSFIVRIDDQRRSRVTVLDGRVRMSRADDTGEPIDLDRATVGTFDPASGAITVGPLPSIDPEIVAASFDADKVAWGMPRDVGVWSGDKAEIVGSHRGVRPAEGDTMLRFVATREDEAGQGFKADVYQIVSLTGREDAAALIDGGGVVARATAAFNRVDAGPKTDARFGIKLYAYAELTGDRIAANHDDALVWEATEMDTDADASTWEDASVRLPLPPGTRHLVVQLQAIEDKHNDSSGEEFAGHYADDVRIEIDLGTSSRTEIEPTRP